MIRQRFLYKKGNLTLPTRRTFGIATTVAGIFVAAGIGVTTVLFPKNPALAAGAPTDFVTTWKTDNEGVTNDTSIRIVAGGAGGDVSYNYEVDWDNDGVFDQTVTTEGPVDHDFGTPGEYTVRIRGDFHRLSNTWQNEDTKKLISIDQWGAIKWRTMNYSFANMPNLNVRAADAPDLSMATDISVMFAGSSNVDADFSHWDTSTIVNMGGMFQDATSFNGDISSWDTSGVTNMAYMFQKATSFNQSIDNWDVSNVENTQGMFSRASSFNQSLGVWDISSLANANEMFGESGMTSTNYDATLIGWSSKPLLHGVSFLRQYGRNYCTDAGAQARQYIIDTYNWQIGDGGWRCGVISLGGDESEYREIDEGMPAGSVVGVLATSGFSPIEYSLTCENPGADDTHFAIIDSQLVTKTRFEYGNPQASNGSSSYSICIRAFDGEGRVTEASFVIGVANVMQMRLDRVSPSSVYIDSGNQSLSLYGEDLDNVIEVKFGDRAVDIEFAANTTIYVTVPTDGMPPGTVDITVKDSSGETLTLSNAFTYNIRQPKAITGVELQDENHLMIIHGTSLLDSKYDIEAAFARSLVTLNGQALPFCSYGFGGMSAEEILVMLDMETNPALVSDTPACYQLVDYNDMEDPYRITETQAVVMLPDDFDTDAMGTVAVNGSPVYTFNQNSGGDGGGESTTEITPMVELVGGELGQNPFIQKRPTFQGEAEPGARVVVTVHSDPISCSAIADSNGNWSCTLPSDLEPGNHTVFVRVTNPDGSVVNLGPYSVRVAGTDATNTVNNQTPLAPNAGVGLIEKIQAYKEAKDRDTFLVVAGISLGVAVVSLVAYTMVRKRRAVAAFVRR